MTIRWRTLEWVGAYITLMLQTGAFLPLLMLGPDGVLDDAARAKLRLTALPVYAITAVLLSRHLAEFVTALRRNLYLLVLLALPVLSVVWSVGPTISLRRAIGLIGSVLLSYLLAIRFTPRQLLVLVVMVVGPCMIASLLLAVFAPQLAFMPMETEMRGVFVHKNGLGWAAALSTLATAFMVFDRQYGNRLIGIPLLISSLACLVASKSMTGLVTTVAYPVLLFVFLRLTRSRGLGRVTIAICFLQLATAILIALSEFLPSLLTALGKDATLTGRVPLWDLVGGQISRHLALGFGFQAFWTPGNADAWAIWTEIGWLAPHAHNGYYETILGLGLVGFTVLILVLGRGIYQGAALQFSDPDAGWLWLNVLIGSFLVMNLTESMFLNPNDVFWLLISTALISFSLQYPEITRSVPGAGVRSQVRRPRTVKDGADSSSGHEETRRPVRPDRRPVRSSRVLPTYRNG